MTSAESSYVHAMLRAFSHEPLYRFKIEVMKHAILLWETEVVPGLGGMPPEAVAHEFFIIMKNLVNVSSVDPEVRRMFSEGEENGSKE